MTTHLTATINDATQYATVYVHEDGEDERPVATLVRRRIYERGPAWTAYSTDGLRIRTWMLNHDGDYLLKTLSYSLFGRIAERISAENSK